MWNLATKKQLNFIAFAEYSTEEATLNRNIRIKRFVRQLVEGIWFTGVKHVESDWWSRDLN